ENPTGRRVTWASEQLGRERNAWLQTLPMEWRQEDRVALVHAVPGDLWQAVFPETGDPELGAIYPPLRPPPPPHSRGHLPHPPPLRPHHRRSPRRQQRQRRPAFRRRSQGLLPGHRRRPRREPPGGLRRRARGRRSAGFRLARGGRGGHDVPNGPTSV